MGCVGGGAVCIEDAACGVDADGSEGPVYTGPVAGSDSCGGGVGSLMAPIIRAEPMGSF